MKPASRMWNLLGMLIGTGVGGASIFFPEPYRTPVVWIGFSSAFGLMGTLAVVVYLCRGRQLLASIPTVVWWTLISIGFFGGAIAGYTLWVKGTKLPEDALGGVMITGLLVGFAVTEVALRISDKERQLANRTSKHDTL